jgi:hypothetical protein
VREIRQSAFALRVWQKEGRISNYVHDEVIQGDLDLHDIAALYPETRPTTVEVARMLGHPSSYGLLGAEFMPDSSGRITVEVALSGGADGETVTYDSLAAGSDTVRAGLPREYGSAVLQTGTLYASALGPGTLRFDDAAHGMVGSSVAVFGWLTRIVLQLLVHEVATMTDDELMSIARAAWRDTLAYLKLDDIS